MTSQDLTDVGLVEFYHPTQQQAPVVEPEHLREALLSLLGSADGVGTRGDVTPASSASPMPMRRRLPRRVASTRSVASLCQAEDMS